MKAAFFRNLTSQLFKSQAAHLPSFFIFFQKLLHTRYILLTISFLSFLLASLAAWSFVAHVRELQQWKEKIVDAETKLPLLETLTKREKDLFLSIREADPYYLEHQVCSMRLSRLEAYSLESAKHGLNDHQMQRLRFLMSTENTLQFVIGKTTKGNPQAQEIKQDHPVEVDETDIQRILAHIEGINVGPYAPTAHRPPMTMKKFSLKRKKETSQGFPSYLLDIELWRREASQKS